MTAQPDETGQSAVIRRLRAHVITAGEIPGLLRDAADALTVMEPLWVRVERYLMSVPSLPSSRFGQCPTCGEQTWCQPTCERKGLLLAVRALLSQVPKEPPREPTTHDEWNDALAERASAAPSEPLERHAQALVEERDVLAIRDLERAEAAEAELAALRAQNEALRTALRGARVTLSHAQVFIASREKMHPDGVRLYQAEIENIDAALQDEQAAGASE